MSPPYLRSHLAYMNRLGLWGDGTSFASAKEFQTAIDKRGEAFRFACGPSFAIRIYNCAKCPLSAEPPI